MVAEISKEAFADGIPAAVNGTGNNPGRVSGPAAGWGCGWLATVANSRGEVIEQVVNPGHWRRRCNSCGTCRGASRAVAAVLAATSKRHNRFPGYSAGLPTSAAITFTP